MQKCIEHIRNVGIKNRFLRNVVFKLIFDILLNINNTYI